MMTSEGGASSAFIGPEGRHFSWSVDEIRSDQWDLVLTSLLNKVLSCVLSMQCYRLQPRNWSGTTWQSALDFINLRLSGSPGVDSLHVGLWDYFYWQWSLITAHQSPNLPSQLARKPVSVHSAEVNKHSPVLPSVAPDDWWNFKHLWTRHIHKWEKLRTSWKPGNLTRRLSYKTRL